MFADLLATPGVEERLELRDPIGVLALHGGLEAGTAEVAIAAAAEAAASVYAVVQPPDLRWHIPSIRYEPAASPALRSFLEHVNAAVSIHGFGRRGLEGTILLGGSNRRLAGALGRSLRRRGFEAVDELERIPKSLRGVHPANPVNLPAFGGVQVELSPQVRTERDLAAVRNALASVLRAEGRSLCVSAT